MHVRQANANEALEGLLPDVNNLEIHANKSTLVNLLDHAKRFVVESRNRVPTP